MEADYDRILHQLRPMEPRLWPTARLSAPDPASPLSANLYELERAGTSWANPPKPRGFSQERPSLIPCSIRIGSAIVRTSVIICYNSPEACAQISTSVCAYKSRRLALDLSIEATLSKTQVLR